MTKIVENKARVQHQLAYGRQRRTFGAYGAATILAVSLWGCSLSAAKEGELFTPSSPGNDAAQVDTFDASQDAGTSVDELDTSVAEPFDSGGGEPEDAGEIADAAEQDAGPSVFDPQSGLVVHYRFNETSGNTVNDFASDKDAIIVGVPTGFEQWVSPGRIGGALRLSGETPDGGTGHYVELPQGILLGQNETSISLWVNRTGGPMWQRVFDFGSGPPDWIYFSPVGGTGLPVVAGRTPALIFVDFIAITDAPAGVGQLKINQPIAVSTWVHFVLTWSASELKVYLNGQLAAQAVPNGQVTPTDLGNTSQNYLGRSQFVSDPYFNGLIDEFRIYNRVLSASDVSQLYELQ